MEGLGHSLLEEDSCFMVFNSFEQSPYWGDALLPQVIRQALRQLLPQAKPQWVNIPPWLCDNCLADPQIGVPSAMVFQKVQSQHVWHTSMDTPDRISGDALRFLADVCAAFLSVAAGGEDLRADRLTLTARHVLDLLKKGFSRSAGPPQSINNAETGAYWLEKSRAYVRSALRLGPEKSTAEFREIDRLLRGKLAERGIARPAFRKPRTDLEKKLASMVPARRVFGNLTLRRLRGRAAREAERFETAYSMAFNAPVFWMDGERSCHDIYRRLIQEREAIPLELFHDFCIFLKDNGYIAFA